jgi:cytochrome c oxidase subunit 2
MIFYFKNFSLLWINDSSEYLQTGFQDPASSVMDGIFLFNTHLLFVISSIVVLVGYALYVILVNFSESESGHVKEFSHSSVIEIIWTSIPAFILLSLSSPSFSLLYSLDEISNPELSLKIIGHQWYWSYETSDFNTCGNVQKLKFSSYLLSNEYLMENSQLGFFRGLETNKRVVVPSNTHLRLLVTAVDVLHSWTVPSFGVKVDACPGRLNQANVFIKRCGVFFGQCSEICGVNHGFMPIVVLAVPSDHYHYIIMSNLLLAS